MEFFDTKIVGVTFDNRQGLIRRLCSIGELEVGTELLLKRDIGNPYDSNAVGVYTMNGEQLGFLAREIAQTVSSRIQQGYKYKCRVMFVSCGGVPSKYGIDIRVTCEEKDDTLFCYETYSQGIIINRIANYFGVNIEEQEITITSQYDYSSYRAKMKICKNINASRNQSDILVKDSFFMYKQFIGSVPEGYNKEEFVLCVPIPGSDNDSYDNDYLEWAYESVGQRLKLAFPQYPIYLDNLFGKVCFCLMFDMNKIDTVEVNSRNMYLAFNLLREVIDGLSL